MTTTLTTTKVALATIAGALAFLVAGVGPAAAAPAASLQATNACWKDVVNDWLHNQPNLKGTYAIPCYTQAIQHLNSYPDLQGYSSAADDIRRALFAVLHQEGRDGGGSAPLAGVGSRRSEAPERDRARGAGWAATDHRHRAT